MSIEASEHGLTSGNCFVGRRLKLSRELGGCDSVVLRQFLMQSDLQSVGNGDISTFARAFAPKMCETAVSRFGMT